MKKLIELNEIDLAVAEYLKDQKIEFKPVFVGTKTDKDWQRDQFSVTIKPAGKYSESFEFNVGIGHRLNLIGTNYKLTQSQIDSAKKLKSLLNLEGVLHCTIFKLSNDSYAVAPTQASVLYSLILDSDCGSESFNDFCDNYGYNPDSMKDFRVYQACMDTAKKLRKLFTSEQIKTLRDMLQDY